MSNEAFEKWFENTVLNDNIHDVTLWAWQAAKADSEREIAELIDELVRYKIQVQYWKDFCEKVKKIDYNDYFLLQAKNSELSASINDLREALEDASKCLEYHYNIGVWGMDIEGTIDFCKQALSKTPAQSLQEHDNEVIEKCAKVCDINRDLPAGYSAKEIRALKG